MVDKNCIHFKVCGYSGFACEDCEKCKFREYNILNTSRQVLDVNEFQMELEKHGADVVEFWDGHDKRPTLGYSPDRIQEVVESCKKASEEAVGVCIEHEWAEEEHDRLISNFECPYCHEWHRENAVDQYCTSCVKRIMIVHKDRKKS